MTVPGDAVVTAFAYHHRPAELEIGTIRTDRTDIELHAEAAPKAHLLLTRKGKPATGEQLVLVDLSLSDGRVQPGTRIKTDAEGRISTARLTKGRHYHIFAKDADGYFTWDNQPKLDLIRDLGETTKLLTELSR